MSGKVLCWLALGAAVCCLGCAPVDEPTPPPPTLPEPTALQPEAESIGPPKEADRTRARREAALRQVRERDLLTTNSFWTVFHGILGVGPEATLLDPETNRRVNAIDYICRGGEVRGLQFIPSRDGLD